MSEKCSNFVALEQDATTDESELTEHQKWYGPDLAFNICSYCQNFRAKCDNSECSECAGVAFDFYCSVDKHNIE